MARFFGLPAELKMMIIEHVSRPSDLKSLALVSRNMHILVTPYIYREVVLPYGNESGLATVNPLLQSRQRPYVRVVKLVHEGPRTGSEISWNSEICWDSEGSRDEEPQTYSERCLEVTVKKLLTCLPHQTLTRLEWDESGGVSIRILRKLWQRHRGIQHFRLPTAMVHHAFYASRWEDDLKYLRSIVDVNLTLRYPDDRRVALKALEYLDQSRVTGFSIVIQRLHGQESEWAGINRFLLGDLRPTLNVLRLVGVNISVNGRSRITDVLSGCIDLPVLNRLEMRYCTNMDIFFAVLRTPVLKHFELRLRFEEGFDTLGYCDSVNAQLNKFLRRFYGLQTLLLQTRLLPQTIEREVIQLHAPTLRIYLNDRSSYCDLFEPARFKALKQFAIYQVHKSEDGSAGPDYRMAIANFCNSTPLTTLGILCPSVYDPIKPWKESLRDLADSIFAATTASKLRVIAFGLDHDDVWPEQIYPEAVTYPNRLCFMRRTGSDELAGPSGLAVEFDEKEVKWLEAESEIVQYRFNA